MTKIKDDLINSVNATEDRAREINVGAHLTSVQGCYCGIASTICDNHGPDKILAEAGNLDSYSLFQLAHFLKSEVLLTASVGMAALNSLIELPGHYTSGNAFDMIRAKSADKNLGIIGHFHFADRFKDVTKNCWVFEKSPRNNDLPEDKIDKYLPECDVVVITGQTIINNTLAGILAHSKKAFKVLVGPSVPLCPILFDYGIDVLAGVKIIDCDSVNHSIRQGANFRQLKGIELLMIKK